MASPRYIYVVVETDRNGDDYIIVACESIQVAEEIAARVGGKVESIVVVPGHE